MKKKYYGATIRCKTCNTAIQSKHVHDFAVCNCWELGTGVAIDGGGVYLRMACCDNSKYEIVDGGFYYEDEKNTAEKKNEAEADIQEEVKTDQDILSPKKRVHARKPKVPSVQRKGCKRHSPHKG